MGSVNKPLRNEADQFRMGMKTSRDQRGFIGYAVAVCVIAFAFFAAFGDGAGAKGLTAVGEGGVLAGDGKRFTSFQTPGGIPVVLDSRTRQVRKIQDAKGCLPADIGFGRVLLDCTRGWYFDYRQPRIASVWTGVSHPIKSARKEEDYDDGEIGKFWVRGDCDSGSPCTSIVYRNFRTGKAKRFSTVGNSADIAPPGLSVYDFDLDFRHLGRYKPHPRFSIFSRNFDWSSYVGFGARYYLLNEYRGVLMIKSRKRTIRIGPFLPGAIGPSQDDIGTGSGRIVWVSGRVLHCFDLGEGQRIRTRLGRSAESATVVRNGAVVAFPAGNRSRNQRYRIRIIRF